MEKLLNLLNEYQPLESKNQEYCIEGTELYIKTKVYAEADDYLNYTPWVISKKFGFIQWLVDDNKIDIQWAKNILYESEIFNPLPYTDLAERLIMYLSISNDPISFLVSILK